MADINRLREREREREHHIPGPRTQFTKLLQDRQEACVS